MQIFEQEINGSLFKTVELDGESGLTLALDIMQVVGPALAQATSGWDSSKSALEQNLDVSTIIKSLLANMSTDKTKSIIKRLLATTFKCEQREHGTVELRLADKFADIFRGKKLTTDLFPVLMFVFKVNFGDFSLLAGFTSAR